MNESEQDNQWEKIEKILTKLPGYIQSKMDQPWLSYPTVRDLARRYHCSQSDIIDAVESHDQLDLIVGMGTATGVGKFESKGDYRVEYYE